MPFFFFFIFFFFKNTLVSKGSKQGFKTPSAVFRWQLHLLFQAWHKLVRVFLGFFALFFITVKYFKLTCWDTWHRRCPSWCHFCWVPSCLNLLWVMGGRWESSSCSSVLHKTGNQWGLCPWVIERPLEKGHPRKDLITLNQTGGQTISTFSRPTPADIPL